MSQDEFDNATSDLESEVGLQKFVEHFKETVGKTVFHLHGVPCIGAILAKQDDRGNKTENVQALMCGFQTFDELKRGARKNALKTNALGVLLVRRDGRRVIFQLEHREFGERAWYATVDNDRILGGLRGPVAYDDIEVPPLRALPERYMS